MKTAAGVCQCGCGQSTQIPVRNDAAKGWTKGQPLKFIKGHNLKLRSALSEDEKKERRRRYNANYRTTYRDKELKRLRAYHLANREAERAYRLANGEKNRQSVRRYYRRHRQRVLEARREHRAAHLQEIRKRQRERYAANPESYRTASRNWRHANPEKVREHKHKRRALLRGGGESWTAIQWETLKRQLGHRCVGCWKTETELAALGLKLVPDHIVPLAKGGMNDICNIQPLCNGKGGCNSRKGPKYVDYLVAY